MSGFWESLPKTVRSLVISLGAIVLATLLFFIASVVFPTADFTPIETVIVTAFSGFVIALVKNYVTQ